MLLYTKSDALYIHIYFDKRWRFAQIFVFEVICNFLALGIKLVFTSAQTKHQPMKNINKTTVILKALDLELKALLLADLGNFKALHSNQKQSQVTQAA